MSNVPMEMARIRILRFFCINICGWISWKKLKYDFQNGNRAWFQNIYVLIKKQGRKMPMRVISHSFKLKGRKTKSMANRNGKRIKAGKYINAAVPARKPQSNNADTGNSFLNKVNALSIITNKIRLIKWMGWNCIRAGVLEINSAKTKAGRKVFL